MIFEHLLMVLAAIILAVALGIPLGLLAYLYPAGRKLILRVVDLIQTTPALALLGIIMVFMGAGKPTVVLGLALYSSSPSCATSCWALTRCPPPSRRPPRGWA